MAPMNYTLIEDTSQLPLLNPELASRKTLKLRLSNGLEALLISDPQADQSAAAVCVGAGSWNDPLEYPGMAHFCEHMLFMGTQKYPNENAFFSNISNYAGSTNAYTAANQTVYMFSAQASGFLTLLDQFAHFFIDPLFNPSHIAREMHAVDQEFAKNVENDSWREYMVFKETGNKNHPNRMFSIGNSETLSQIPQSALKTWNRENYGAERMHAVLYSSLPIETLKEAAIQAFSEVPQSPKNTLDHLQPIFSKEQQGHILFIKPIQNRQRLTLSWELPPVLSDDKTKSAETLAYALQRGQKYGLYETLKEERLIDTMFAAVDELGGPQHRFFQITLELTKQGIEQVERVILRCFEAIAGLRVTGVPLYLFQEKNAMAKLNYQYQERQDPFSYITRLGDTLPDEDLASFPREILLATQYSPEKIALAIDRLKPESCVISLMASPEVTQVPPNRKERWLGAEYAIRPIPESWLTQWAHAKPNPNIRLADPNPFIPEHLSLAPDGPAAPISIATGDFGSAYYVRSPEFGTPNSVYHLHIRSPELSSTARSTVLASLYLDHLTDLLHPTLTAASAAGLSCSFSSDASSIHFQISGYSEKAPLLLQEVTQQMPLSPPTAEQFAIYVDRHEKEYLNAQKKLAAIQAKELLDAIVDQDRTTNSQKFGALQEISYENFLEFHSKLFETTYLEALFAGNLTLKEAESAWLDVIHVLGKAPYPKEEHRKTQIVQFNEQGGPYQITQRTDVQGNATILLLDEGHFTFKARAAQEILAAPLKDAFFNELRTKQKTGYIAQAAATEMEERLFQYFVVQSNSHQPEDLLYRFEQFLEEYNDALSENISSARFETLKASQINSLKTRFRNLQDKAALWDQLAFDREGDFAFIQKRIDGLSQLSYDDFLKQASEFLTRDNRKRLAILFEGKLALPFAYAPIEIQQIEEIATYAPRDKKPLEEAIPK